MATKNRKRRKRSGRIFYPIYWILVLMTVAAIGVMMRVLWDNMEDYEASMPKYVAADVTKMVTSRDFSAMYDLDDTSLCAAEGKDAYVAYMERLTSGQQITCTESFSANPDEKIYQIKVGDRKLGYYKLGKSGEVSEYGYDLWELKELRTNVITQQTYSVTVPETSLVYADKVLLDASHITESDMVLYEEYLPEGVAQTEWCTYSVSRCFSIPEFDVLDYNARVQTIAPSETGRLTASVNYDDDWLRSEVEDRVIQTAKVFALFTSDDTTGTQARSYTMPESKARQYIRGFDGGWFRPHRDVRFENMVTEHYRMYEDGTFSCDIFFDYVVVYKDATEVYPTGYTFFFEMDEEDHVWMLYDFISKSKE